MPKSNSQIDINSLSVADREALKKTITIIDGVLTTMSAEREYIKNAIDELAENINVDKKLIRKLAKTFNKASFEMDKLDNETFEEIYTTLYTGDTSKE
jgi:phosphopantothenate synthetase